MKDGKVSKVVTLLLFGRISTGFSLRKDHPTSAVSVIGFLLKKITIRLSPWKMKTSIWEYLMAEK
jgi:hypothetical protein